ncbi:MucR family transcriptional regulator [Methylobacterium marchantiae]|uniref:MucR family transcriptional regulator n=1 Tax=Methylobacterium marchantiae TaxID=600331 RepID=A0ABW3X352_9HYPH|nr:hypothetical protein AIGOOFII_4177 [Methylobacterium marchantiae]
MDDVSQNLRHDLIELTADIVSAYVSNNSVPAADLPLLLSSVHGTISSLAASGTALAEANKVEKLTPAQIKKSITPDALISFEDGKPYKTLKRHLTIRDLTPETYRAKHGLPADYPMTAAGYSAKRSALALHLGLGQKRKNASQAVVAETPQVEITSVAPAPEKKRAGRPRKVAAAA